MTRVTPAAWLDNDSFFVASVTVGSLLGFLAGWLAARRWPR